MPVTSLRLMPVPPFRLDLTVWVLKRRPEYVVDNWDGETYRRTLMVEGRRVGISVRQLGSPDAPELDVMLFTEDEVGAAIDQITESIERLLGTTIDLTGFYQFADSDTQLRPLVNRFKGFKPTRYPTVFECLTNAITCQLVSLNVGLKVVSRLVNAYDDDARANSIMAPGFPTPETIARAAPDHLRQIGFSRQKARALIELAQGLERGEIEFDSLPELDDASAIERLASLRGVGRWTAEYTLLRGLGRLHIFPGDDVGARNTLQKWRQFNDPLTYDRVREILNKWQPYGGLIYFHMLLLGLESKGCITIDI